MPTVPPSHQRLHLWPSARAATFQWQIGAATRRSTLVGGKGRRAPLPGITFSAVVKTNEKFGQGRSVQRLGAGWLGRWVVDYGRSKLASSID